MPLTGWLSVRGVSQRLEIKALKFFRFSDHPCDQEKLVSGKLNSVSFHVPYSVSNYFFIPRL
jgi:hypothetical protein